MVKALFNAVIVKRIDEEESTYGTIVVPDMGKEKNIKGEVVSTGPGVHTQMGHFVETTIQIGDVVLLPQMGPTTMDYKGEEYLICQENQILAIIEE
ncbi:co-chaperone GroES [bacterium]|nr:co-chaperone GroES [bacterium]